MEFLTEPFTTTEAILSGILLANVLMLVVLHKIYDAVLGNRTARKAT